MATGPALAALQPRPVPKYQIVTNHKPAAKPGMPGPYPGRVVTVQSAKCIDETTEKVDVPTVQTMIARGMSLSQATRMRATAGRVSSTRRISSASRVNASGAPGAMSMPEVVAEITRNLTTVGVKPTNIVIHERGGGQILNPKYDQFVPAGVRVESANTWLGFDPDVYVEVNFWGEEDTRWLPDADGFRPVHQDHQRAEHEGSRRVRRHRMPEEHRLRRVRQRGALAL